MNAHRSPDPAETGAREQHAANPELEAVIASITPENAGKTRSQLSKAVVLAIRNLMKETGATTGARDLAAFIVLALLEIDQTIETSVLAWEKRGYWVKADRFRMEWEWAKIYADKIKAALIEDDWGQVAQSIIQISRKLQKVIVSERNRIGRPWEGAWDHLF